MKSHVEKWGRATMVTIGRTAWARRTPGVFRGLTGVDEEFRHRSEWPGTMLYETRLSQLVDVLGTMMVDFGGRGRQLPMFTPSVIPVPGTLMRCGDRPRGRQMGARQASVLGIATGRQTRGQRGRQVAGRHARRRWWIIAHQRGLRT